MIIDYKVYTVFCLLLYCSVILMSQRNPAPAPVPAGFENTYLHQGEWKASEGGRKGKRRKEKNGERRESGGGRDSE